MSGPSIGLIGGTNILYIDVLEDVEETVQENEFGSAEVDIGSMYGAEVALIRRHGRNHDKPPHVINHPANMKALKDLGVDVVLALSSTGALKSSMAVPSMAVPEDYVSFFRIPTIYDHDLIHITPEFDAGAREVLIRAARPVAEERGMRFYDNLVYVQTTGPRLETKAETRFLSQMGDLAGMTVASEATVAQELGLRYAALCTIDNYAHGVGEAPDYRKIKESAKEMADVALEVIKRAVRGVIDDSN